MLTAVRLRELLHYDPVTGIFTWKVRVSQRMRAGSKAGTLSTKGYIVIGIAGKFYRAHRLAWLYMTGEWPEHEVDHRIGVRDDNRWSELREATQAQNMQNRPALNSSSTGVKGVVWRDRQKKYQARLTVSGKRISLGYFHALEDASAAYAAAAREHHGEFARAA